MFLKLPDISDELTLVLAAAEAPPPRPPIMERGPAPVPFGGPIGGADWGGGPPCMAFPMGGPPIGGPPWLPPIGGGANFYCCLGGGTP